MHKTLSNLFFFNKIDPKTFLFVCNRYKFIFYSNNQRFFNVIGWSTKFHKNPSSVFYAHVSLICKEDYIAIKFFIYVINFLVFTSVSLNSFNDFKIFFSSKLIPF